MCWPLCVFMVYFVCVCGCSRLCVPAVATGDGVEDLIAMPRTYIYAPSILHLEEFQAVPCEIVA